MRGWFVSTSWVARSGLSLFTTGMILTEGVLFLQGLLFWAGWGMIPGYYWILFGVSMFLPTGIITLLVHAIYERRKEVVRVGQRIAPSAA